MTSNHTAMTMSSPDERVTLHRFQPQDVDALVAYWNRAFADQRNFVPLTVGMFSRRVLDCAAFDAAGLILAWHRRAGQPAQLAGLVHALKPAPQAGLYAKWTPRHQIALLHVDRAYRGRGIGGRLLQAAENWLYYCPVHVGGQVTPCYSNIEGPRPPFFGSAERMGIPATARNTIHFFAAHGYAVDDPGDVSMVLQVDGTRWPEPAAHDVAAHGLQMVHVDNEHPFTGTEPTGRDEYTLWADNDGAPYAGLVLTDGEHHLRGHISWYPLHDGATIALGNFWLAPQLRGQGLGAYLLDSGLHAMTAQLPQSIDLHTHLVHHARAVELYEARGFTIDMAWVNLVKT